MESRHTKDDTNITSQKSLRGSPSPLAPAAKPGRGDRSNPIEVQIGQLLTQRGLTLAAAESCTGGLVSHRITNVPGSSDYFIGGIVAYSNQTKMALLGVHRETLESHGAVSQETVLEMALGVRQALNADIGIAVSGIAGPGGATPDKPVGLVWFALSAGDTSHTRSDIFPGDRLAVKEQSAQAALQMVIDYLGSNLA